MGGSSGSSSSNSSGMGFENITSTYTPNPQAMASYNKTLNMAENLADQPYQPYTGQMIAGFTPEQMAAFQGVRNLQGYAQPYINAGANAELAAMAYANPANYTAQALQQYYNPYQQSAIQATQNLMNQQNAAQQSQLLGQANTQAGGARFNDRTGIAQAALARQQALANNSILANMEQQGYQNAQQQYNQQQQAAIAANQAGAYGLGQLGNMGQQATMQQLQALLGVGGQQQQLAQQQLSGAYQQYLNAMAWPYQQTQFLAGIASGIGPNMGGTTQTTGFGQNMGSQSGSSSQMGGSAQSGMGLLSSALSFLPMLSDEDDKTDITKLTDGDIPLYSYRYKDDPKSYPKTVGPMAQDIEKHYPEHVSEVGGHKVIHKAAGGAFSGASAPSAGVANPLGGTYSGMNPAAKALGALTPSTASAAASASDSYNPSDTTQAQNSGFGNIGYAPSQFLAPNMPTGLAAVIDPQAANEMAQSRWMSDKYAPEPAEEYADGGRIGYAGGGNPNILPNLQNIYGGNPEFMGLGSLLGNGTMPYSGQKLQPIQAHPHGEPQHLSMGFIPKGPRNPGSAPSSGGGGGGGGDGGGKSAKPPQTNANQPLGGAGGTSAADAQSTSMSPLVEQQQQGPVDRSVEGNPVPSATPSESVMQVPAPTDLGLDAGSSTPLTDYVPNLGGFKKGGRVGYADGSWVNPYAGMFNNNSYNQDVLRNMQNLNYNFTPQPYTPPSNGYFNNNPMMGYAQGQNPIFANSPYQAPSQATPFNNEIAQRAYANQQRRRDGGRLGFAGGGAPAAAPAAGGLGNLGNYSPTDPSPLAAAGNLGFGNAANLLGTKTPGSTFTDLADQWISNHVIAPDPTPESQGFPSMAQQTNPTQPRPNLPSQEMVDTAGLTNLSNQIDPGIAAVFGGGSPMTALALSGSLPKGAAAGAPFGGASKEDLQARRDALLKTPQPAAGYARGDLTYNRMTPEGLFGTTPVGYYTEPLYAKGGRVHKDVGGVMSPVFAKPEEKFNFATAVGPRPFSDMDRLANAIAKIESGGRYNITGPRSKSGDYPYGKYQIMGANIPKWGAEAGYKNLTPAQFLANPDIQEKVARTQFAKILAANNNNPVAVAGEWLGGPGWRKNTHADALGTTVPQYQRNFLNAYNGPSAVVASDRPAMPAKRFEYSPATQGSNPLLQKASYNAPMVHEAAYTPPASGLAPPGTHWVQYGPNRLLIDNKTGAEASQLQGWEHAPENIKALNGDPLSTPAPSATSAPSATTTSEQLGFFDQLGSAFDEIGNGLGELFGGGDNRTVASDNQPNFFDSLFGPDEAQQPAPQQPAPQQPAEVPLPPSRPPQEELTPPPSAEPANVEDKVDFGNLPNREVEVARGGFIRRGYATDGEVENTEPDFSFGDLSNEEPQQTVESSQPAQAADFNLFGGLGDLFSAIGGGLGELFGVNEAEAAPAEKGKPTGGAPGFNFAEQTKAANEPFSPQAAWNDARSSYVSSGDRQYNQLLANQQQLLNAINTAPNSLSLNAAKSAYTANEANLKRLEKQREMAEKEKAERVEIVPRSEYPSLGLPESYQGIVQRDAHGRISMPGKATTEVNVGAEEGAFEKEIGKKNAENLAAVYEQGNTASENLATTKRLMELGDKIGTGGPAFIKSRLGELGIQTEGLSDIQAYDALLNKLTPAQRIPGTGATSDFDARMFRNSLPRLINTPEGNRMIAETMQSVAEYERDRADIAGRVLDKEITLPEARKLWKDLAEKHNPYERFKEYQEAHKGEQPATQQNQPSTQPKNEPAPNIQYRGGKKWRVYPDGTAEEIQ